MCNPTTVFMLPWPGMFLLEVWHYINKRGLYGLAQSDIICLHIDVLPGSGFVPKSKHMYTATLNVWKEWKIKAGLV